MSSSRPLKIAFRVRPLFKKLTHIAGEVLDQRQVAQRLDGELVVTHHLVDVRAAGPARNTVDHHRAGTAHADPAGETVAEAGIGVTLNPGDHVEDGLAGLLRHGESVEAAAASAATPDAHGDR